VAKPRPIVVIDTSVFLTDRIEAAQLRFVVSENRKHLKPGTSYASFLCVTSHGLLEAIE
jgi:hypothetical protein